jgi:AAA15 family ATPase/GTPase
MLCQFKFKNFFSYKNETLLDMLADSEVDEFTESLIGVSDNAEPLLPIAALYGPNGGGKSNAIKALSFLVSFIGGPIKLLSKAQKDDSAARLVGVIPFSPFIFDDHSKNNPSEFEIITRTNNLEYKYCVSLYKNEVLFESLEYAELDKHLQELVFERNGDKIVFGSLLEKEKEISTSVGSAFPYLSFLSITYNFKIINDAVSSITSCDNFGYYNTFSHQISSDFDDKEMKVPTLSHFRNMDIPIIDYRIDHKQELLFVVHNVSGNDYDIPLSEESDGTKKIFIMLNHILVCLKNGKLVLIDEIDAQVHPQLLRYIILLFKNPEINKNGAQLIFTSHDMTTMTSALLRRDEIWFAARDEEEASELYSLSQIRDKNDEMVKNTVEYNREYLAGRYKADPYLSNMLSWEG